MNSSVAFEIDPYWQADLQALTIDLGCIASKWANENGTHLITSFANFLFDTHNNTGTPASLRQIARYLGSDMEYTKEFLTMWGPQSFIVNLADTFEIAQHPKKISGLLPCFLVLSIITMATVILRLYSRHTLAGRIKAYDWVLVFGFFLTLLVGALGVAHDMSGGIWAAYYDSTWNMHKRNTQIWFILNAIYPFALAAVKASLLIFYYDLSKWKPIRIAVIVTAAVVAANTLALFFGWVFQCHTVAYWTDLYFAQCTVNITKLTVATGAINIFTDVIIWILPMPLVWKLQLYPRERILAIFTFSMGAVACIASAVRIYQLWHHLFYSNLGGDASVSMITVWTMLELNLAIICASAPAIRALVVKHAPMLLSSAGITTGSSSSKSSSTSGSSIMKDHSNVSLTTEKNVIVQRTADCNV